MHIYSSLGVTHKLSTQAASPVKKTLSSNRAEANNKLDNNKVKKAQQTQSFKDKLSLSKQALGFQDIAKKYDPTNISSKELQKMADELRASNLISYDEYTTISMHAIASLFKGFKVPEKGEGEFEAIMRSESEKINFSEFMYQRLQYDLSENKSRYKEIDRMKDAVAVLDKLTALRG